jgi:hypothetical protein
MSAPVQPLTLQDKVKETPEQKAARKAAQAAMTPEQRAAFVSEKEKVKAKEAEEKAKLAAAKGILVICCFSCKMAIHACIYAHAFSTDAMGFS